MSEQMRKEFEAHMVKQNVCTSLARHRSDDTYRTISVQRAWELWQAALATQPQAPQGGVTYGCHCDIEQGFEPDGCVLDEGNPNDCVYAMQLQRKGQKKEACSYWRPIVIKNIAPTETPEAGK